MIQTPKTEKLLLTLAIFTILFILSLSVNAFYFEDDYVFMVDLQQNGLLKNCTIMYNTWDGRFFTLGAFAQGFCLLYFPIGWITFFWSICFLTSGFLIYYIIKLETNLPEM